MHWIIKVVRILCKEISENCGFRHLLNIETVLLQKRKKKIKEKKRFSEIWRPLSVSLSSIRLFVLDNQVIRARDLHAAIRLVEPGRLGTVGLDRRSHFIIITAKAAGALLFVRAAVARDTVQLIRRARSTWGSVESRPPKPSWFFSTSYSG